MNDYRTISRVNEDDEAAGTTMASGHAAPRTAAGKPLPPPLLPPPLLPPSWRQASELPPPAVESDPLLASPQLLSAVGRSRSTASCSSSSSAATAVKGCPGGGGPEGRAEGSPDACGGRFPWNSKRTASPPFRVCAVLAPEKVIASHGPCGHEPWKGHYGLGTRRRSSPRAWLYLVLAAFTVLAFFAIYDVDRDDDEEPLNYYPQQSFHFLENRERLYGILSESVQGFSDPANKIRVVVPAARRPRRAQTDLEYEGWRQASNVLYVMGEFNVADSLVVLTAKPVEARRRRKGTRPCSVSSTGKADDGAETDGAAASNTAQCVDTDEQASYAEMDVDVYLPTLHAREKVFSGELPTAETLKMENKVASAQVIDPGFVDALEPDTVLLSPEPLDEFFVPLLSEDVIARLADKNVSVKYSFEVHEAFVEARFVKSAEEIRLLRFASRMSAKTHKKLDNYLSKKKKVSEIELASYFKNEAAHSRLRLQAYPPIVGSGQHAAILHYRTGENSTAGYAPIGKNTFVLVDAAGEYHGYASDITRTITRKKHWSKQMIEVYKIVKTVQQKALDYFAEGRSWSDIAGFATETLVEQLLHHNFLVGNDLKLLINSGVHSVFMPHGLGHPVGLDVHDPIPAKYIVPMSQAIHGYDKMPTYLREILAYTPCARSGALAGAPSSDFKIVPGYVSTIEPGVYFIPLLFDLVLNDPEGPGQYINWAKINRGGYFELGGVRIEDVVMIDREGKKQIISRL